MKTADHMYEYCKSNKLGPTSSSRGFLIKTFSNIAEALRDNEDILTCFVANRETNYSTRLCVCSISNQRIIISQKNLIGKDLQTIAIDNVNDITVKFGLLSGRIVIDTFKEVISMTASRNRTKRIDNILHNIIQKVKEKRGGQEDPSIILQKQISDADELLKYKQLLDAGVISNEEFDKKKKELLGL